MSRQLTCLPAALALALALVLWVPTAAAVTVDGVLDAEYGTALVTQSVQTSLGGGQISGDNNQGDLDFANGSELDLGHAFVADGVLHLFLAGNLALMLNANQNGTVRHVLDFFVDAVPGGQQTLNGVGAGHPLNGLTFDAGFEADFLFELEGDDNGFQGPREWTARTSVLPTGGGGSVVTLGWGSAGGPGTLLGGTNPHGILATIDNRNVAGVTFGCGASSGAGVTRGVEWAIPLAAIGTPQGCIRIAVIIRNGSSLSNQVLAPVPVGTCPLGSASTVDFASIAGDQCFTVCPAVVDVPGGGQADLALAVLGPNPSPGDRLRVAFSLPDARPARLQIFDGAGRVVRSQTVGGGMRGPFVADLSDGRRLAPGVYWLRLSQGRAAVTRKLSVVR